jgi:hypothetical protein
MQQFCTYGSVRGASGNRCPYRDKAHSRARMKRSVCTDEQGLVLLERVEVVLAAAGEPVRGSPGHTFAHVLAA